MMADTNLTCLFDGCDYPVRSKKLCSAHYTQHLRGKTLRPLRRIIADLNGRIDARIVQSGDCWQWSGAHADTGYAQVRFDGRLVYVHRAMFERAKGPIAAGMVIDHVCHNRGCVNPDHLEAVTNKQNIENRAGAASHSFTGIRGVSFDPRRGKWYARVKDQGKAHWLGYFDSVEDADRAASKKRREVFTNSRNDDDPAAFGDAD